MQEIEKLLEIMQKLRGKDGCPWDREQDHQSLRPYLLEEAYEVLDALDKQDMNNFCEELGDLLLQIVFHARIAEENGSFTFADVVRGINEKMIRRHPHVFGEIKVKDSDEVLTNWEEIKAWEKRNQAKAKSVLDEVPGSLPALMLAEKVQKKAAKTGFDWPNAKEAWSKVQEELSEVEEAFRQQDRELLAEELGDLFFALVNITRLEKLPAEMLLHDAVGKFKRRFAYIEKQAEEKSADLAELTLEEMDKFWDEAKKQGL